MAKDRCTNPGSDRWYRYGARGIEIRFKSFEDFYAELGPRPSAHHSLDRIDNNGHYEPGNVKWSTRSEQQLNRNRYTIIKRSGRGCYFHKASGKWLARVKFQGETIYLGLYSTQEAASAAYTNAFTELKENYEQRIKRTGVTCQQAA